MLFDQHDVRWVPRDFPGGHHLTAFNNGTGREYSSVVEIAPPIDENGEYILDDEGRYGPEELVWEYTAEQKKDFYSSFISGASRQANGNTLICEGSTGRFFEVNSAGQVMFEYVNPFGGELTMKGLPNDVEEEAKRVMQDEGRSFVDNNALFRVTKYAPDYPGLAGRALSPLESQPIPFSSQVADVVKRLAAQPTTDSDAPNNETDGDSDASDDQDVEAVEAEASDSGVDSSN